MRMHANQQDLEIEDPEEMLMELSLDPNTYGAEAVSEHWRHNLM